jgi:copper(I)-binding protein/(2Fe-2S) ferredoxin
VLSVGVPGPVHLAPLMTVYPDGIWYGELTPADVEDIVSAHLVCGEAVARLAYRTGDVLRSDPQDRGDADDPMVGAAVGAIVGRGIFARRAMHVQNAGAVFGVIENKGAEGDTLLDVVVPDADKVWFHDPTSNRGCSLPLEIAPGQRVVFEPGRLHLMLGGLMHRRGEGEAAKIVFRFKRTGDLSLDVPIHASPVMPH